MRGKVSDQDLTDYALNELPPNERLYVESMLGISEECRNDVYRTLDLSEMLKEGLELEEDPTFTLDAEQRNRVLRRGSDCRLHDPPRDAPLQIVRHDDG